MATTIYCNIPSIKWENVDDLKHSSFIDATDSSSGWESKCPNIVTQHLLDHQILLQRGDIIEVLPKDRRFPNEGQFVWDGHKAQALEVEDFSLYAVLPKDFEVSEVTFSPRYWKNCLDYDKYFWPCPEYRQEVAQTCVYDDALTPEKMWHGTFTRHGKKIHLLIASSTLNDPKINRDTIVSIITKKDFPFHWEAESVITVREAFQNRDDLFCLNHTNCD